MPPFAGIIQIRFQGLSFFRLLSPAFQGGPGTPGILSLYADYTRLVLKKQILIEEKIGRFEFWKGEFYGFECVEIIKNSWEKWLGSFGIAIFGLIMGVFARYLFFECG